MPTESITNIINPGLPPHLLLDYAKSMEIVFVKDFMKFKPITNFFDLPKLKISEDNNKKYNDYLTEFKKNPKFRNDLLFLITGIQQDSRNNTVNITAVRCDFVMVRALDTGIIDLNSEPHLKDLSRTGILNTVLTNDGCTVLLRRSRGKLTQELCPPAGSLSLTKAEARESNSLVNFVVNSAKSKLLNGFLQDENMLPRAEIKKLAPSAFTTVPPRVDTNRNNTKLENLKTIEFYCTTELDCNAKELAQIVSSNVAPDNKMYTDEFYIIDLNNQDITEKFIQEQVKQHLASSENILFSLMNIKVTSSIANKHVLNATTLPITKYLFTSYQATVSAKDKNNTADFNRTPVNKP